MFGNSTEKRVLREADKIVSLKEDMDSLSWGRVMELGKILQEEVVPDDVRIDAARELVSIAQSNLSMYARLGVEPAPAPARVMASGIEVMEGGLAAAALDERPGRRDSEQKPGVEVPLDHEALRAVREASASSLVEEPAEDDFEAAMVHVEQELVAGNDPDESDFSAASPEEAERLPQPEGERPDDEQPDGGRGDEQPLTIADILDSLPPIPRLEPVEEAADGGRRATEKALGDTEPFAPYEAEAQGKESRTELADEGAPTSERSGAVEDPVSSADSGSSEAANAEEPSVEEAPSATGEASVQAPDVPPDAVDSKPVASADGCGAVGEPGESARVARFARFRNLYESRDGGLCVFEDEHGHLVAVDSSKLA